MAEKLIRTFDQEMSVRWRRYSPDRRRHCWRGSSPSHTVYLPIITGIISTR